MESTSCSTSSPGAAPSPPPSPDCHERWRRGRNQVRPGGPGDRSGISHTHRPLCAKTELRPRLFGHAQERHDRSRLDQPQGNQTVAAACPCKQAKPNPPTKGSPATSSPWQSRKSCTPGHRSANSSCPTQFPKPMVGLAVTPKSRGDETKLSEALSKITQEDSTVTLDHDPETKEMVLTGMSELHLTLIRERLKRRDKVEVDTKEPKVPYRETIQGNADGSYRHKKQSGGSGQFGEVHIRMYPFPKEPTRKSTPSRIASHNSRHRTTTTRAISCGSIRSSAARYPATLCRPSKRVSSNASAKA